MRNAIHAFDHRGLAALQPKSSRPHTTHATFDARSRERLRALLHQSPRIFGKPTSVWTLDLAAEVSFAEGITPRLVSDETIRAALAAPGVRWQRAKHWITSPDPAYARKTTPRPADPPGICPPTWAVGFLDEVWWSRLAQPEQHRWVAAAEITRLQERERAKADPAPQALACYGVLVRRRPQHADQLLLRFVAGRPVRAVTIDFLAWCSARLAQQGVRA